MQTIDIGIARLLLFYVVLLLPVGICLRLKLDVIKTTAAAVVRMTVQLGLVALYLEFIFSRNNLWLNLMWIVIMLSVAAITVIRNSGLTLKRFFPAILTGISTGTLLLVAFFVCIAVQPSPLYDARYLIPITGMILGNCLRANIISLERFYTALLKNEKEYLTYLFMGATRMEAVLPYMREAIRAAIAPTLSTMATLGLVSLPGMMTGQILGGAVPVVAIKYQIAIMIAIFCATVITITINIRFSLKNSFNRFQILDKAVFAGPPRTGA